MTRHVSVDIETWGKRAGYDIRSIGACVFHPWIGFVHGNTNNADTGLYPEGELCFYRACDNPLRGHNIDHYTPEEQVMLDGGFRHYNLKRDPDTVAWWESQGESAKAAFVNPIDLKLALMDFTAFIHLMSDDIRDGQAHDILIYSHGASYDPTLLEAAYIACDLPVPWFYRSPRDTRSIFDDAGIYDHSAHLKKHRRGIAHHALHDAITQAHATCEAKQIIAMWRRAYECSPGM